MEGKESKICEKVPSPKELKEELGLSLELVEKIKNYREQIYNILKGKDNRKIFLIGPCSIHNSNEAIEYAKKFKELHDKVKDKIFLLMRVYLEKPRTVVGWKGFINDPYLDGSCNVNDGLKLGMKLLIDITEIGVPISTEFLEFVVYPYIEDLVSWASIGARTVESQVHREMVSGLGIPIGFKNSTNGSIQAAINAIISASNPHSFIGIDENGDLAKICTKGNSNCVLILRGGETGPNYEEEFVRETLSRLDESGLNDKVIIDCSHGNSLRDYKKQSLVFRDVLYQMKSNSKIVGLMVESNLEEGKQAIEIENLKKGVSVTDSCISFSEAEKLVNEAYEQL